MNVTILQALAVERRRDLIADAEHARAARPRSTRRTAQILRELMFAGRREPAPVH
jgi:hypothetical protein